jgi:hypothetical protein
VAGLLEGPSGSVTLVERGDTRTVSEGVRGEYHTWSVKCDLSSPCIGLCSTALVP